MIIDPTFLWHCHNKPVPFSPSYFLCWPLLFAFVFLCFWSDRYVYIHKLMLTRLVWLLQTAAKTWHKTVLQYAYATVHQGWNSTVVFFRNGNTCLNIKYFVQNKKKKSHERLSVAILIRQIGQQDEFKLFPSSPSN